MTLALWKFNVVITLIKLYETKILPCTAQRWAIRNHLKRLSMVFSSDITFCEVYTTLMTSQRRTTLNANSGEENEDCPM